MQWRRLTGKAKCHLGVYGHSGMYEVCSNKDRTFEIALRSVYGAVSYTHLDVYKRQVKMAANKSKKTVNELNSEIKNTIVT